MELRNREKENTDTLAKNCGYSWTSNLIPNFLEYMTIAITTTIIADINGNVIGVSLASDNLWILCAIDDSF